MSAEPLGVNLVVNTIGTNALESLVEFFHQGLIALFNRHTVMLGIKDLRHRGHGFVTAAHEVVVHDGLIVNHRFTALCLQFHESFGDAVEFGDFGVFHALGHHGAGRTDLGAKTGAFKALKILVLTGVVLTHHDDEA